MKGKEYEAEVLRYLKKQKNIFIVRKNEGGFTNMQGSETTFTPSKGIDFFLVSSKYENVALEVKYTSSNNFAFDRLKKHQMNMLQDFENSKAGVSFILLGFNDGLQNILFDLKRYNNMQKQRLYEGVKSINIKLQRSFILHYGILVERYLIRKNYGINLNKILIER